MQFGLEKLYLFPVYQTRAQYLEKTGRSCPAFDKTKAPKYWEDPNALKASGKFVIYPNALAVDDKGHALLGADGRPYLEPMPVLRGDAAVVNIPLGEANEPGGGVALIPCPCRALKPYEELTTSGFGGTVMVRDNSVPETGPTSWTHEDRRMLEAIAKTLEVTP